MDCLCGEHIASSTDKAASKHEGPQSTDPECLFLFLLLNLRLALPRSSAKHSTLSAFSTVAFGARSFIGL